MKILYAASNSYNSLLYLERFVKEIQKTKHTFKIAAYQKSSPNNINIDYTLDFLLDIFKPDSFSIENNNNFLIYCEQIEKYNPDLIISDLEYFTSNAAIILNKKLWQCSSSIINYALTKRQKYTLGLFKQYAYVFNKNYIDTQKIQYIICNSDKNYIYSHFCDVENVLETKDEFEWIRPYYILGKHSIPCQHDIVGISHCSNKNIVNLLEQYSDTVLFTNNSYEKYDNVIVKNLNNKIEYACNIKNSHLIVNEGYSTFLADAFYNGKPSVIYADFSNQDCILNMIISDYLKLSNIDLDEASGIKINLKLNSTINFLHEKIEEFSNELK